MLVAFIMGDDIGKREQFNLLKIFKVGLNVGIKTVKYQLSKEK